MHAYIHTSIHTCTETHTHTCNADIFILLFAKNGYSTRSNSGIMANMSNAFSACIMSGRNRPSAPCRDVEGKEMLKRKDVEGKRWEMRRETRWERTRDVKGKEM